MTQLTETNKKDNSILKLKKHGGKIVTIICFVLVGYFGWQYMQNKLVSVDKVAAEQYASIQNLNDQVVDASLNTKQTKELELLVTESESQMNGSIDNLVKNHGDTIYAWQALMIKARKQTDKNDYKGASKSLKSAMSINAIDAGLKAMTQLRYAQALLADGKTDEAQNAISVEMPNSFEATKQELLGDIYLIKGNTKAAKNSFENALSALSKRKENRPVLLLKMEKLGMSVTPIKEPVLVIEKSTEEITSVDSAK